MAEQDNKKKGSTTPPEVRQAGIDTCEAIIKELEENGLKNCGEYYVGETIFGEFKYCDYYNSFINKKCATLKGEVCPLFPDICNISEGFSHFAFLVGALFVEQNLVVALTEARIILQAIKDDKLSIWQKIKKAAGRVHTKCFLIEY